MAAASPDTALGRVRNIWWDTFKARCRSHGTRTAIDTLDLAMYDSRPEMARRAGSYATASGASQDSERWRLLASQFMKSNTGKMFERLVGLALAYALNELDAPYCVLPCRTDTLHYCHGMTRSDLAVRFVFGDGTLYTHIDADLMAFNPSARRADIYLISVKSTLKDRFHNVPVRCPMNSKRSGKL